MTNSRGPKESLSSDICFPHPNWQSIDDVSKGFASDNLATQPETSQQGRTAFGVLAVLMTKRTMEPETEKRRASSTKRWLFHPHQQDQSSPETPNMLHTWRLFYVAIGCVQCTLASGVLYGWSSVEGAGSFLTSSINEGGAGLSTQQTTWIFAKASSISMMASLVLGFILDRLGPRMGSTVSHVIILAGVCLMIVGGPSANNIEIATCLMAFAGPGIQASVMHLSNLFPGATNLTMATLAGCISFSFAILPCFQTLWEVYEIRYQSLFCVLFCMLLLSMLASLRLWPDQPFKADSAASNSERSMDSPQSYDRETKSLLAETTTKVLEGSERHPPTELYDEFKSLPLYHQLASGIYVRMLLIFLSTSFSANLAVAALPVELFDAHLSQAVAKSFSYMNTLGFFASLLTGYVIDRFGLVKCSLWALTLGIMYHVLTIWMFLYVPQEATATPPYYSWSWMLQVQASFITYVLFRQFNYRLFFSSVAARCGYNNFGMLTAMGLAMSGVVQLVGIARMVAFGSGDDAGDDSTAATTRFTTSNWFLVHGIQILIFVLLMVLPAWDAALENQLLIDYRRRRTDVSCLKQDKPPRVKQVAEESLYGSTHKLSDHV